MARLPLVVKAVYNTEQSEPNEIETFAHCARCLDEVAAGRTEAGEPVTTDSPRDYARLSFGIRKNGTWQLWCVRHDCNVAVVTLSMGVKQ